jgi:hypothetical protein
MVYPTITLISGVALFLGADVAIGHMYDRAVIHMTDRARGLVKALGANEVSAQGLQNAL